MKSILIFPGISLLDSFAFKLRCRVVRSISEVERARASLVWFCNDFCLLVVQIRSYYDGFFKFKSVLKIIALPKGLWLSHTTRVCHSAPERAVRLDRSQL